MSLDLFLYDHVQRALVAGLLVAVFGSLIGVFLVLRQLSLLGDGLAHVSFAGVAVGLAADLSSMGSLVVALAVSVGGAILIHILRERQILKGDAATGILLTGGLATGILVISATNNFSGNTELLTGQILGIKEFDLWAVVVVGGVLALLLALFYKEFFSMTFSEESARVTGLPVDVLNIVFMAITAATIVVCSKVVGVLLVSALVIVPAASALQFARSFRGTIVLSMAFATTSVVVGLVVSTETDWPMGASIAVTSICFFLGAVTLTRLRLLLRKQAAAPSKPV